MIGRARTARIAAVTLGAFLVALASAASVAAADYAGPLIDAHSHVPNATVIDAYVAAMKRHGVTKVVLLGVGGVQKEDAVWIAAAAKKYPDRVVPGVPVAEPTAANAGTRLDAELKRSHAHVVGEVHVRQASRKIDRDPSAAPFLGLLRAAAAHQAAVVIHAELDERATAALERALTAEPAAVVVLAHAGEAPPALIEALLNRRTNLRVDLSGMHFQRTPSLATETGPLDPAWKALIEKLPDRFLMGVDVWAPRLFEPKMLDRLLTWTRRILGELRPDVAERVAWKNASALYRIE